MTEVHSAFKIVHSKAGHIEILDQDNGVAVTADIKQVVSTLRSSKAYKPGVKVIVQDSFGLWDVIAFREDGFTLLDLEAPTREDALKAA